MRFIKRASLLVISQSSVFALPLIVLAFFLLSEGIHAELFYTTIYLTLTLIILKKS
jgi:hypothetical protein